jgi:hypothetical protein
MQIPLMPEIETFAVFFRDLIVWKAKLYEVIRKTETLDKVDKSEVEPLAKKLNGLMDDLDKRMQLSFFNQANKL